MEIRKPPGSRKEYFSLSEPEIKVDAVRFRNEGLQVSFVNTSLLKFGWPASEPAVRVFTGSRVEDPRTMFPRIVEALGETALDKDGYQGKIALETHIFDGMLIAAAHKSMDEIMHIVGEI